jgi:putative SOS response-associated peptidase YedK
MKIQQVKINFVRLPLEENGYYEWRTEAGSKQPYYFTARDGKPLTIAGLWDEWRNVETGEQLRSCTMLVTKANKLVSDYHDRMPMLLGLGQHGRWLEADTKAQVFRPAPLVCRGGAAITKSIRSKVVAVRTFHQTLA